MNFSAGNGIWIGAATLFIIMILLLPLLLGRQATRRRRRLIAPFCNLCNFLHILCTEPRSTVFHTVVNLRQSFSKAYKASKKWLGRFHARWLRPRLYTSHSSLLPLHRMHLGSYHRSKPTHSPSIPSFLSLPYDIRFVVYEYFIRLFPCPKWNITNTMQPDPDFLHAMAFIRTCKLVREELGPRIFQRLEFETDAKYPFYRNLPDKLTRNIRNLSLHIRRTVEPEFIHSALLQQLEHLRNIRTFAVSVAPIVLVDLDREFEHILHRFKWVHPYLKSLTVMTRISAATAVDDLIVAQALRRLSVALLPDFGIDSPVRASVWTKDVGKGRFRPATGWYCKVSNADDPAWSEVPSGAE